MKKLFLALLLLPVAAHSSEKQQEMQQRLEEELESTRTMLKDPEYIQFILGNRLDLHIYGVMTPFMAGMKVGQIHQNLESELAKGKNFFEAGKSLPKNPDATIINTCATIEQNLRKNGEAGIISGNSLHLGNNQVARWFTSKKFDGQRFFDVACPCYFYQNLSTKELEQLRQGTQQAGK